MRREFSIYIHSNYACKTSVGSALDIFKHHLQEKIIFKRKLKMGTFTLNIVTKGNSNNESCASRMFSIE